MKQIPNLKFYSANFYESRGIPTVFGKCPDCDGDIHRGMISCPDDQEGCLVGHCGNGCSKCKKVFEL